MADVVTDGLRVRSAPGVGEESALLEPLLVTGDRVFIVQGPVRADDYDWYEVVPERPVIDNIAEELPTGWVAAGDHDGTPWLQPAAPGCPTLPVTLSQLLDLTAKARLACYGSQELSFEAFVPDVGMDIGALGPCFDLVAAECALTPSWLMAHSGTPVTPADGPGEPRYLFVAIDPGGLVDQPRTLDSVRLVGSFDHPAARDCRHWDPSTGADLTPRTEAVVGCRSRFVVSSQEVLSRPPEVTPMPDPSVVVLVNEDRTTVKWSVPPGSHIDVEVALLVTDLAIGDCSLVHVIIPDDSALEPSTVSLEPLPIQTVSLIDGEHDFRASCESSAGTLAANTRAVAADRQPELCRDFEFEEGPITVSTYQELSDGMIGTWEGCVDAPWVPLNFVTVTFGSDGTYSADAPERLDGEEMVPFYWDDEEDSPAKTYTIDDLQDSLKGVGTMGHLELRNIRLMGDLLEFEVFEREYGPVTVRLSRL
jgi:hypothetical protein